MGRNITYFREARHFVPKSSTFTLLHLRRFAIILLATRRLDSMEQNYGSDILGTREM